MARYIDANKIIYSWTIDADGTEHDGVTLQSIIDKIPTADVVEVVRCKDCGAYLEYSHCEYMGLNGFCSLGFRTPKERGGENE